MTQQGRQLPDCAGSPDGIPALKGFSQEQVTELLAAAFPARHSSTALARLLKAEGQSLMPSPGSNPWFDTARGTVAWPGATLA